MRAELTRRIRDTSQGIKSAKARTGHGEMEMESLRVGAVNTIKSEDGRQEELRGALGNKVTV
jgi:hypothetical protein